MTHPTQDLALDAALDDARAAWPSLCPEPPVAPLREALVRERGLVGRLRCLPHTTRAILIAALVGIITATAMWLSPRPDLAAMAPWTLIAGLGLLGALFVGLSLRGFRPLHRSPQPWPARSAPWLLALGVPITLYLWLATLPSSDATLGYAPCLSFGLGVAALFAMMFLLSLRAPRSAGRGALLGLAAGVGANLALMAHCPDTHVEHLVGAHAGVILLAGGLVGLGCHLSRRRG